MAVSSVSASRGCSIPLACPRTRRTTRDWQLTRSTPVAAGLVNSVAVRYGSCQHLHLSGLGR
jgi:hypothetical protein